MHLYPYFYWFFGACTQMRNVDTICDECFIVIFHLSHTHKQSRSTEKRFACSKLHASWIFKLVYKNIFKKSESCAGCIEDLYIYVLCFGVVVLNSSNSLSLRCPKECVFSFTTSTWIVTLKFHIARISPANDRHRDSDSKYLSKNSLMRFIFIIMVHWYTIHIKY